MAVDPARAKSVFLAASDLADPAERAAYLDRECGGDADLRARVEALCRANAPAADATVTVGGTASAPTTDYPGRDEYAGATIAGKYTLVEPIGEGGMGAVWRARQTEPVQRFVAVKVIKAGMDSKQVLARFEAERQALALMDHPNIAKVLDGGVTGGEPGRVSAGRPFFVMELVKGVPITEYCDARKLTPKERLELFVQACQAIQHAHQKGVIHRDIKPSNVLVALYDDRPVVKVIDFGVAKATGQALTAATIDTGFGGVVGTPQYMSPEQATFNNLDIDTRSDVYALGVLLYELLTGSPPFASKELEKRGLLEMLRVVREEEPPRPSTKLSTADALPSLSASRGTEPKKLTGLLRNELDWIVMKALEKDRSRRYETANGFAADVLRYLSGEAVLAHPPSAAYRVKKFVRRHKGQVIAASLVLFALVAGLVGTSYGLYRADRERERATAAEQNALENARRAMDAAEAERLAKADADARRREAERNLAYAMKGNEILGSVFAGLDPKKIAESGRPLQDVLRENLVEAVQELDGSAVGDPLAVARMQDTLGTSLLGLGEAPRAVEVFEKARATRAARLGADHPETLVSMSKLALAYRAAGHFDRALELFEAVLRGQTAKLGADHLDTLSSMDNLAVAYQAAGQLDRALPLSEQALRLIKVRLGADHPLTLRSLNNLTDIYRTAGQVDRVLPLSEEVLRLAKSQLGADHPYTLVAMDNLAGDYRAAGQLDRALTLSKEALNLARTKLGSDHPQTLRNVNNLGVSYQAAGQLDRALPLFEEALKIARAKLGPDHPQTLITMSNLAVVYQAAGQVDRALPLLEDVLRLTQTKLGADHPDAIITMGKLAAGYRAAGEFDRALALFEKTVRLARTKLGADHPETLSNMSGLAATYWSLRRLERSIPLFEELLSLQEGKFGRAHPNTLGAAANLGVNYKDAGRVTEAVPLLEEAYRASEKHPTLRWVGGPLLDAYARAGKPAEAAKLVDELLAHARKALPEGSPHLAGELALFGMTLLETKRPAKAEPLLRECLAIREKTQPNAWSTFNTHSMLGGALLGQKKYAEAEPLLLKGYEGMKAREKTIPPAGAPRLREALDRLVAFYAATNRPDEATKWRAERATHPAPVEKGPKPREQK